MAEPQQALSRTFPVKPKLRAKSKKPSKTPESKYWSSFKSNTIPKLISSVTSISFSPAIPHHFAAAYSTSLTLFNSKLLNPSHLYPHSKTSFRAPRSAPMASLSPPLTTPALCRSSTSRPELLSESSAVTLGRFDSSGTRVPITSTCSLGATMQW